ncbi:MAG TPA: FtsK/SpoIIIE domain-containing protein [Pirellulales bacterium]|nr:FtsK/SpoIIIE domain-containing protein [Pirellulales bacterium]
MSTSLESADESWPQLPAAPPVDPLARLLRFVADLSALSADRDMEESRIESRRETGLGAAQRTLAESQEKLAAWFEKELTDATTERTERRQAALSRYQVESTTCERQFVHLQEQAAEEFDAGLRLAKRTLEENGWEAEAYFDGNKGIAPKALEEFTLQVDAWRTKAAEEQDKARALLKRWKQKPPDVAIDQAAFDAAGDDYAGRLPERVGAITAEFERLTALTAPGLAASRLIPWFYLLALALVAAGVWIELGSLASAVAVVCGLIAGIGSLIVIRGAARSGIAEIYPHLVHAVAEVNWLLDRALAAAKARTEAAQNKLIERRDRELRANEEKYQAEMARLERHRVKRLAGPSENYPRHLAEITAARDHELTQSEENYTRRDAEARRREAADSQAASARYERQIEQITRRHGDEWQRLLESWRTGLANLQAAAAQLRGERSPGGPDAAAPPLPWLADWDQLSAEAWTPAAELPPAIRFGTIEVRLDQVPEGMPKNPQLAELSQQSFGLPALVPFPAGASLLFKARGDGRRVAVEAMQAVMLRLLASVPPAKIRFTIIDPVGLGENFAAFMHLADYQEQLVTSRIWTEPRHIEDRLADLSEHMENVIQKYLRNEFASIEQYNRDAGEIAEPFRFLVIANFPANFSEAAQRRLLSIAASGPRCGVYTLVMVDTQAPLPPGFSIRDLEQHSTTIAWNHGQFVWRDERFGPFRLTLDAPPAPLAMTRMLQSAGQQAKSAGRVEVPFEVIAPAADDYWTSSAQRGFDVPLGRAGATRLQSLLLGSGTSQHVLVAGKTGSGKSTLLHALVTNLALRYSPDEAEVYLIDFKQGVEFKTYATHRLPHARVVAIESDREFGVSVLGRLDAELKTRADLFRAAGVQDLAGFRQAEPDIVMPRAILIIDEFQEFFVEDDRISQDASLLLDRLVRQGRAFGIHVLLGSQTLAGTYSLARSTLGQMAVRIALQCSEADAHLILSEENSAARLLSRAGEAIYNDSNGLVEGNHPFQVVWLPDSRREVFLEQVQHLLQQSGLEPREQIVFEGNVPAEPERNKALQALLSTGRPLTAPAAAQAWLGDAVAIKDPTSVVFQPQSGNNLLIVGQSEEAVLGIFNMVLVSLAAQFPRLPNPSVEFYLLDGSAPGTESAAALQTLATLTPDPTRHVGRRELAETVSHLAAEVDRRLKNPDGHAPPIYVFLYGLHKLRDLRRDEDDFGFSRMGEEAAPKPAKQFGTVLRDGPAVGIYTIAWCDSLNNLNRAWDRSTLREFETRIVFQMSANDSSTLIDTPAAGKLGMHRALLHSEEQAILEKFRPYRWPSENWLEQIRGILHGENPDAEAGRVAG